MIDNLSEKNLKNPKIPPRLADENRGGLHIINNALEPLVKSVVEKVNKGLGKILKDFSPNRFNTLSSMEIVSPCVCQ